MRTGWIYIKLSSHASILHIPKMIINHALDRVYAKQVDAQKILQYEIIPMVFSDHDQVKIVVKWGDRPRWGPGTWKMNTQVLEDPQFAEELPQILEIHRTNKLFFSNSESWDHLKLNIKKLSIKTANKMNKHKTTEIGKLENELLNFREKSEKNPENEEYINRLQDTENELKSKYKTREEGERIRSKLEKFENNEKPTKYFFRQERKRGEAKQINILVDRNNRTINTKDEIMKEIKLFYAQLYKTETTNSTQALHVLVAISEHDSFCRPRLSICLPPLINPIAHAHLGIPSFPSVKSPLLLPLLLSLPTPLFPLSPPSHLPLPIAPLSTCTPPQCHPLPIPVAPLPIAPFQSPPPGAIYPSPSCPPSPRPLPTPLPAFSSCQHPFPHCPSPHRHLGSLIDSN